MAAISKLRSAFFTGYKNKICTVARTIYNIYIRDSQLNRPESVSLASLARQLCIMYKHFKLTHICRFAGTYVDMSTPHIYYCKFTLVTFKIGLLRVLNCQLQQQKNLQIVKPANFELTNVLVSIVSIGDSLFIVSEQEKQMIHMFRHYLGPTVRIGPVHRWAVSSV